MESRLIQKYKEYISFLRANEVALCRDDNWDMLFQVLKCLRLSEKYTLDDYRSKESTNNILKLYARKANTDRPSEEEFQKVEPKRHSLIALMDNTIIKKPIEKDVEEEHVNLPERVAPESVVTFDFAPEAIWEAYLLKTTDYYIGQRWHGFYHKMTIPANIEELMRFKPWREIEIPGYWRFITETEFDFDPKITINGDVATIEHIGVFFLNRICKCRATLRYNREARIIENYELDDTKLFEFSPSIKL